MIAAFLLLLQAIAPPGVATQSARAAPPATTPAASVPLPPQDWSRLPMLPIRRSATIQANTSMYVRGEVMAGRCAKAVRTAQGWTLTLDLAVLATPQGRLRRVTPRAIDCPTVEQYAAGVVVGAARDSIDLGDTQVDTWYRTTMTFSWAAS